MTRSQLVIQISTRPFMARKPIDFDPGHFLELEMLGIEPISELALGYAKVNAPPPKKRKRDCLRNSVFNCISQMFWVSYLKKMG